MWGGHRSYAWAEFLASLPESDLRPADRAALQHWAKSRSRGDWYDGDIDDSDRHANVPCCHELFTSWSRYLVGVDAHLSAADDDEQRNKSIDWSKPQTGRVGYLSVFLEGDDCPFAPLAEPTAPYRNDVLDYANVPPGMLSAGFHQVAPILVQMNMMKMNEVLAVENPEVHLHPGAQLKFAAFFIENALIGKYSLIETHSDLFIRRVMRAIAAEQLRQSWVNIAFVQVQTVTHADGNPVRTATVQSIQRDQSGIITNWPEGFLSDDVRESEDLLRTMYGERDHSPEAGHE